MNRKVTQILYYLAIVEFFLYWLFFLQLSFPSNNISYYIKSKSTRFRQIYITKWNLFTPPATNNYRLYFIVTNLGNLGQSDTIEVLEKISLDKQQRAPFNQREIMIDYLVFKNTIQIMTAIYLNNQYLVRKNITDTSYIQSARIQIKNDKLLKLSLENLTRYGVQSLVKKKIDTANTAIRLLIKEKMIRPFSERNNSQFESKEKLFFEITCYPFNP